MTFHLFRVIDRHYFKEVLLLNSEQGKNEIAYRLAMLKLKKLLEDEVITEKEYKKAQKGLIKKYKPIIGCLDA